MVIEYRTRVQRRINEELRTLGGLRRYVMERYARGDRVLLIARSLNALCPDERVAERTVYLWIREWKRLAEEDQPESAQEAMVA